jgi:hypothetical protein
VPAALERVAHRALERDPQARHLSMADFEQDLIRAQREAELGSPAEDPASRPAATREPRRSEPPPGQPRHGRLALAVALAAFGVLAAAFFGLREKPGTKNPISLGETVTDSSRRRLDARPSAASRLRRSLDMSPSVDGGSRVREPERTATLAKARRIPEVPVAKTARRTPLQPITAAPDPAAGAALLSEAQRLLDQGLLSEARKQFRAALKAQPRNARALAGLAAVAFGEDAYTSAVVLARKALAVDARLVSAHLVLGKAAFKLHRHHEARRAWEQALRLEPGNRSAKRGLERLARPER